MMGYLEINDAGFNHYYGILFQLRKVTEKKVTTCDSPKYHTTLFWLEEKDFRVWLEEQVTAWQMSYMNTTKNYHTNFYMDTDNFHSSMYYSHNNKNNHKAGQTFVHTKLLVEFIISYWITEFQWFSVRQAKQELTQR